MKIETLTHDGTQWSGPIPALDSEQTLALVFGAPEYVDTPGAISELARTLPRSVVVGCSSAGEIHGAKVADGGLSVAITRFERSRIGRAVASVSAADASFDAGRALAQELSRPDLRGILVLSEGLNVNGSELVRGINSVISPDVVVTGGLAADGSRFQRTWVLSDGKVASNTIVAVGFYGEHLAIGHGSKGGWDKFGPERVVTRAVDNVLYELDGEPALALYKKYLGDRAAGLPATGLLFPLSLRSGPTDEKALVRTVLAIDEAKQSMTFAGDVPKGHLAQFMKANFDRLIGAAGDAALMTKRSAPAEHATNVLSIAISCVGRRLVLGERTEEELESALELLPHGAKQVGFYSYGEISPYGVGRCDLHNQTMTLTTISER